MDKKAGSSKGGTCQHVFAVQAVSGGKKYLRCVRCGKNEIREVRSSQQEG